MLNSFPFRSFQRHLRADPVAIRSRADRLHSQQIVLICIVVSQQPRGSIVCRNQQIQIAIVIEIAVSRAATDNRALQSAAQLRRHFFKFLLAFVAKEVRRLRVLHVRLDHADVVRNVPVRGEHVEQAIEIVVEEKHANVNDCADIFPMPEFGASSVNKPGTIVVIKRHALVREVSDHHALVCPNHHKSAASTPIPARAVPASLNATPAATPSSVKVPLPLFLIELVWFGVVGDEEIHPAIVVVVEQRDAECLACRIVNSGSAA